MLQINESLKRSTLLAVPGWDGQIRPRAKGGLGMDKSIPDPKIS
jgi:hypothetical protein